MANIDTPGGRGRSLDHDIPLVPFIDMLLCLVSFLLITAVWTDLAQINADARVPGPSEGTPPKQEKRLHVEMSTDRPFKLVWREGSTVLNSLEVPRRAERLEDGVAYPELAAEVSKQWQHNDARHFDAGDPYRDQAVLHANNGAAFSEVVAVMDALRAPQRDYRDKNGNVVQAPAFNVVFATH